MVYQKGHCSWKKGSKREVEGNEAEDVVRGQNVNDPRTLSILGLSLNEKGSHWIVLNKRIK